jgi:hypothetical protein
MKTKIPIIPALALLALSILNSHFSTAFAQGSLTPSGPPGATMLTLSQIEPRTPISSAPFVISHPGSYYLTTNVTFSGGNAIVISANNVKLDLNGFTISSTLNPPGSYVGVWLYNGVSPVTNVTIINGFISGGVTNNAGTFGGSGFGYGIYGTGSPVNVSVSGVTVSGCLYDGIYLGPDNSTMVKSCTVNTVGSYGILAGSVSDSTALNCGNAAIVAATTALNCTGYSIGGDGVDSVNTYNCTGVASGNGNGVYALGGVADNCNGTSDGSGFGVSGVTCNNCNGTTTSSDEGGIYANTANNCNGTATGDGDGMVADYIAIGCYGSSSSGVGIVAYIANSCFSSTGDAYISYHYNMP